MQQKRHITRAVRVTLMMMLIALFFVIAPLVVMYTAGYRYNFETKQIIQTGVITIDIIPKDAEVYINDVKIHQSMPIKISNLSPNIYKIDIKHPDFIDWSKPILVNKKETTYISDFNLIKKDPLVDKQALALNKIIDTSYSYDGNYALIVKQIQSQVYEFSLFDITSDIPMEPIMRTISDVSPVISWAPQSNTLAIQTTLNNKTSIKVIDTTTKSKDKEGVTGYQTNSFSLSYTKDVPTYWSDKQLYIGDGTTIYTISPNKTEIIATTTAKNWFVDKDQQVWTLENGNLIHNNQKISINLNIQKILFVQNNIVFAKTAEEIILIDPKNENPIIEKIPATHIKYNKISNQWITWSPWEIWKIDKNLTPIFVNRFGKQIFEVDILDAHGTFVISFEDEIVIYYPAYNVIQSLFAISSTTFAAYAPDQVLLFMDSKSNKQRLIQYQY